MADLRVEFSGISFPNPFMLSSAPPTATGEMIARAFNAGWGGAVTKTLALEKVPVKNVSPRLNSLAFEGSPEEPRKIYGLENIELISDRKLPEWLEDIRSLRKEFPKNVVVASIMAEADAREDWQELSSRCEAAGAQAIELNFSCPHKGIPGKTVGSDIGQDPQVTRTITEWVKQAVKVPVWVKLTPNITDISVPGLAAKDGGADALSAINTVRALTGIDLDTFEPKPTVDGRSCFGGYSGPAVKPIALRIVAELASMVGLPVSGIGGISSWQDAAEFFLVGATTVQVCTMVMFSGYDIVRDLHEGLSNWMEEKGFVSIKEIVGLSLPRLTVITELSTEYRMVSEIDTRLCTKCDLCYVSCRDAGHQAISLDESRLPKIDEEKCTGCSLCLQVCPVWDCVAMKRVEKVPS